MARDQQSSGKCPGCKRRTVSCSYNLFSRDDRMIHSWEHRCAECGRRETQAFRSNDNESDPAVDPTVCPFCGRKAAK